MRLSLWLEIRYKRIQKKSLEGIDAMEILLYLALIVHKALCA
jgi:hypothetical protein